ncbi:MAG: hypothetical protein CO147_01400 [Nitrospirae bacterium CG_4_9_14_3_um_filter_44_28]|nr:MAG: hypothetical protein CO147_01400 [Nitrospirae bacterium CG_4_9_14_3_um_filter_44_28]
MGNIENIKKLLFFIWHNQFSDFYRKKYEAAGLKEKDILNPGNFDKLPFLTRQEIESVSPDKHLIPVQAKHTIIPCLAIIPKIKSFPTAFLSRSSNIRNVIFPPTPLS